MDSLFEPGYFDHLDQASSSSFYSFSSFGDVKSTSLPEQDSDFCDPGFFSFAGWDLDFPFSTLKDTGYPRSSAPSSTESDSSSPSPTNPFQVIFGAFDAPTPAADIGIFHTGSKLGGINTASTRSVSSADGWETLATPSLVSNSSSESVALVTPTDYSKTHKPGFSWDDASTTLSSSSYTPAATPAATAHRVASTSAISHTLPNPHKIRNVSSMPALTEESHATGSFGWFDPTEFSQPTPCGQGDESDLVDNFDWVFEQQGLGGMDGINLAQIIPALPSHTGPAVPSHTTLFSAFEEPEIPVLATGDALDEQETVFDFSLGKTNMTWLVPSNITPDVHVSNEYDLSQQLTTIDPMAMLAPSSLDESRPSSAPHLTGMEGNGLLSLPASDAMLRSYTSPAYASTSEAPYRATSFSYPSPQVDPAFAVPPEFVRRASQPHSIQQVNTYQTAFQPQPAYPVHNASLNAAPTMTRGVTMPAWRTVSEWDVHPQIHAAEAQRIAQEEMAKKQAERAETRQRLKEKVLPMMESSVMQPAASLIAPRAGPPIIGWSGPTAPIASVPVHPPRPQLHPAPHSYQGPSMLTNTPLIVHPSPMAGPSSYTPPQHRIHPPPHPAMTSRPIARLPSPRRNASGPSPTKRSPSGRSRKAGNQGFSWEDGMMFVNYTPKDADKLLSGVAPSGTQSKRKREEEAAAAAAKAVGDVVVTLEGDEADRSKRARSGE